MLCCCDDHAKVGVGMVSPTYRVAAWCWQVNHHRLSLESWTDLDKVEAFFGCDVGHISACPTSLNRHSLNLASGGCYCQEHAHGYLDRPLRDTSDCSCATC